MGTYYVVIEEWNYPTESGSEAVLGTCETRDEALSYCLDLAKGEQENFMRNTEQDCLPAAICCNGAILTTKMGIDPFYYYARYVAVPSIDTGIIRSMNDKAKKERSAQ